MAVKIKVLCSLFEGQPTTRWGGGYEFVYDPACTDYDWLVVFDEMPVKAELLRCPRERTILCTWEPVSIKDYSRAYTRQFGHLLTNRPPEAERHPHYHLGRGYFISFVRDVPALGAAVDKPGVLSVVCSSKRMRRTRHDDRFRLVSALARAMPGLAWYGKGVKWLARKEDALVPYKYHVAIENHLAVHHWSEKFSDAILCECLPFYAGDPDLASVMPEGSFISIPIDDPDEATRIVREAIDSGEYERRRPAILEAKRLILEKYNFWAQVIAVVEAERDQRVTPVNPRRLVRLYARKALRWHSPAAVLEDAVSHLRRFFGR